MPHDRYPASLPAVLAFCWAVGVSPAALLAAERQAVPVLVMRPEAREVAPDVALTGALQARVQSNIAFRINGKVTVRRVEVGQHVSPEDVLATLDPVEQQADVANATAALSSAKALLQQAKQTFERQKSLIVNGYTTRASYDQAQEALNTTQAQVSVSQAALNTASEQLSYADLKAGQAGIIVSRSVEAGQVVQAGQTVFVLAQDGPRDAVFEIPETFLTTPPQGNKVDILLQSNPAIRTTGTVREISPILDASTSTVTVKVGLDASPPGMTLGAAVIGIGHFKQTKAFVLPWSALFERDGAPAVWVVGDDDRVSLQSIAVGSYRTGSFTVTAGLDGSQRVVTAGVQLLFPGQQVAITEGNGP